MLETQEMRVQSLGQEDPLEKEMATHSSIFSLENTMDRRAWWYSSLNHKELNTTWQLSTHTHKSCKSMKRKSSKRVDKGFQITLHDLELTA